VHAKDHSLNAVLKERQQWVIPVYQRHYAWKTDANGQLPKLWNDIRDRTIQVLEGTTPSPHFVGAIIYSEPKNQPFGAVNKRFLVDGQQRISTFSLFLCAVKEVANTHSIVRISKAVSDYLFNAESESMLDPERERFKLWSSSYDRNSYITASISGVQGVRNNNPDLFYKNGNFKSNNAPKMLSAFFYLVSEIEILISEQGNDGQSVETVLNGILRGFLEGFQIVVVQLDAADDAQAIFASLNGNAEPLSAFDLIRNNIFHRASKNLENEDLLYEGEWKRLEEPFWKTEVKQGRLKRPRTDHLIAHTLVAETAKEISVGNIANEYNDFAAEKRFDSVKSEISSLLKFSEAYRRLETCQDGDPEKRISDFLKIWDISAFHPLVMWFGTQNFSDYYKAQAYHFIESYIVRRDICRLTRKNYNNTVPQMLRAAKFADDPILAIKNRLLELEGDNSRAPSDIEIKQTIRDRPIYDDDFSSKKLRYVFRELELAQRTKLQESVSLNIENLTVEHLMPRAWAAHWELPNGKKVPYEDEYIEMISGAFEKKQSSIMTSLDHETQELVQRRGRYINRLGNLTVVTSSLNPSMGNEPWVKKRIKLQKSLLLINRELSQADNWTEVSIDARGEEIAENINKIWST